MTPALSKRVGVDSGLMSRPILLQFKSDLVVSPFPRCVARGGDLPFVD